MSKYLISHKTKWQFAQYKYNIKFRKEFEFTENDYILCGLIYELGEINEKGLKSIDFDRLGLLLGFATKSYKASEDIVFFQDQAEIQVFKAFLSELKEYHLVDFNENLITLTQWGNEGISSNKKYKFFEGVANLYKFLLFDYDEFEANHFPFFKIGLEPNISISKSLEKPYELGFMFSNEQSDNIEKLWFNVEHSIQNNIKIDFIEEKPKEKGIEVSKFLDCNLMIFEPTTINITHNNDVLEGLISELNKNKNIGKASYLKQESKWLYLLKKTDKLIDSNVILTYYKHINWQVLFEKYKERIYWIDNYIIRVLLNSEITSYQLAKYVSIHCPIEKIKEKITLFNDFGIWEVLSQRFDSQYILTNPDLKWSIPIIIQNLSKEPYALEKYIKINNKKINIEDWTDITSLVSDDFIKKNILLFPFNLSKLQSNRLELCKKLILQEPNLSWNFNYVYKNYGIDYLANNFKILNNVLFFRVVPFFESLLEEKLLSEIKKLSNLDLIVDSLKKNNYKINKQKVPVTLDYIDFYEKYMLIQWGEENFAGFEANSYLIWTDDIFRNYKHKITTNRGWHNASITASVETINTFRDINWDRQVLFSRKEIVNNIEFLRLYDVFENIEAIPLEIDFIIEHFISFFINNDKLSGLVIELLNKNITLNQLVSLSKETNILEINLEKWNWVNILKRSTKIAIEDNIYWINNLFQRLIRNSIIENIESFSSLINEKCSLHKIVYSSSLEIWNWDYISGNKINKKNWKNNLENLGWHLNWSAIVENHISVNSLSNISTLKRVADYIGHQNIEEQSKAWNVITKKAEVNFLWNSINSQIERTDSIHHKFKWSWDVISASPKIMKDRFNNDFLCKKEYCFDNTLLTQNEHLVELFKYNDIRYSNREQWRNETIKFLDSFKFIFDWDVLSGYSQITSDDRIIKKFKTKWDWIKIGENSKFFLDSKGKDDLYYLNLKKVKLYKKENDFLKGITSRNDTIYTYYFLNTYQDENLNWCYLSGSNGLKLSNKILIELAKKDWNFKLLSHRLDLDFNNNLFDKLVEERPLDIPQWDWEYFSGKQFITNNLIYFNKDAEWNWEKISRNNSDNLVFDEKLIRLLINKENIDWYSVSSKNNLHIDYTTLNLLFNESEKKLNWKNISNNKELDVEKFTLEKGEEKITLLEKYKDYWDWDTIVNRLPKILNKERISKYSHKISKSVLSKQLPLTLIQDFKNKLNWHIISSRQDVLANLDDTKLENYKYYLDWTYLSANYKNFTVEVLSKYTDFWDWIELSGNFLIKENKAVHKKVNSYLSKNPVLKLLKNLKHSNSRWAGKIYHYTHISNAIKIINEGKIKSRNTANQVNNIAGTVYMSRKDPHRFARFYFRPLTPNQFYNEDLGIQDMKNPYYYKWVDMDYPKCVLPVMFEIDCKELLKVNQEKIWASNGNMQTKKTKYDKLNNIINLMDFENIFCDSFKAEQDKQASQQELLILDELNLNSLNSLNIKIKCTNKFIINQIEKHCNSPLLDNLALNTDNFNQNNKSFLIEHNDEYLNIKANVDDCYFLITIKDEVSLLKIDEYFSHNYEKIGRKTFKFNDYVKIYNYNKFSYTLEFVDNQPIETKQSWYIIGDNILDEMEDEYLQKENKIFK